MEKVLYVSCKKKGIFNCMTFSGSLKEFSKKKNIYTYVNILSKYSGQLHIKQFINLFNSSTVPKAIYTVVFSNKMCIFFLIF